MIADGHIHTPFCPHGTTDSFEKYITRAVALGFKEITFTEHAPLPLSFDDSTPSKDSAMRLDVLHEYFETITKLQEVYRSSIKINRGLEVDYIEGYEPEISSFLTEYGPYIDDSILSVHFLKKDTDYYCLDYSPQVFNEMIATFGGIESVYSAYYQTVLQSITSDLGAYKPKRMGHITLVHKFQKKYPVQDSYEQEVLNILHEMKKYNLQLDYNGAGMNKPLCLEPYPPRWVIREAIKLNLKLVYGSDAHQAKDLGQGLVALYPGVTLSSPTT
ncbi:histidinol-phosphatase HisJ [Bacillus sp. DJP31]|uniref:histidinol-phosphatase HisJ n=1 Tax=Bacillus sp. DJP31 TaxID=3409789 RepID=UPI003BB5B5A7